MIYISKCCNVEAGIAVEGGYICLGCNEECSIKEPDSEPIEEELD